MLKKFINSKVSILVLTVLIQNQFIAQDTLMLNNGKIRYGQVLYEDKSRNFIAFKEENAIHLISIPNLISYSKNALDTLWIPEKYLIHNFYPQDFRIKSMGPSRKLLNYTPGNYTIGINPLGLSNPYSFGLLYSLYTTNRVVELFFQKELKKKKALRFTSRIGINPISSLKTFTDPNHNSYFKDLIVDFGISPIFYFKNVHKLNWFIAPEIVIGTVKKVKYALIDLVYYYTPDGYRVFNRLGASVGFDYYISKHMLVEASMGLFNSNIPTEYFINYYESDQGHYDSYRMFSYSNRLALMYRF